MRHLELRSGLYRDSVRLMQISAALSGSLGVERALVAMATDLNLDLLPDMGIERPAVASPNDLLVAFVARDGDSLATALERLEVELTASGAPSGPTPDLPPPTVAAAARLVERPGVALVSTPGRYAYVEAMDALEAGLSVMVFSDNVPVEQEVRLKREAAGRGLLVMGPDCGTAIIGGVGLGFANVVRPGPVGIVAASGTGAQQLLALLATAGVGVSHCLGVGGRDLSDVVGGASTLDALSALDADPASELIVVLSKPPAPRVADRVRAHVSTLDTPVLFAPLGVGSPDLTAVAVEVLGRLGVPVPDWPTWAGPASPPAPGGGVLRGLFSGGTLCVEAMVVASAVLATVRSNVPLRPEWTVDGGAERGHELLDLGADEYTVGRPHPMIDFGPRLARLAAEVADPAVGVVLLDVVLGHGAHPDPAAELAPAIRAATASVPVVVSLVGTPDDPQGRTGQAEALSAAGARVFVSNAEAARHAVSLVAP
jgi:FdrA protein